MAMDSSKHRTRAFEVYNVVSDEDHHNIGSQGHFSTTDQYDDGLKFVDDVDNGWIPVSEVTFQIEKSPKKSNVTPKPPSPRTSPFYSRKMSPKPKSPRASPDCSPKISPRPKSPKTSPFYSPKTSPKKIVTNVKIESPKKMAPSVKKILPEIVHSNVQQYRPVYQVQTTHHTLINENLVPKPYIPRYTGNITARPFTGPVATPRTLIFQSNVNDKSNITSNTENMTKLPKESKDTRGKVKKTPVNSNREAKPESPINNSEEKLRSSLTDIKKFIEADYMNKNIIVEENVEIELINNEKKGCMNNSRPYSLVLSTAETPNEDPVIYEAKNQNVHSYIASPDSQESGDLDSLTAELNLEESLALSALDEAVGNSKSESFYNCSNQPFNSYNELEIMKDDSDVLTHSIEPNKSLTCDSPENLSTSEYSVDPDCDRFHSPDHNDSQPINEHNMAVEPSALTASGNNLSIESLDGFLSDDMKSLRNFVTQENLDQTDEPEENEEEKEEKEKEEKEEKEKKEEEKEHEEIVEFIYEEVTDSPMHLSDVADSPENVPDENKTAKKSPIFSRFTQKVSDKNQENEEKSKTSPFHPRNFLSFGSKEKKGKNKSTYEPVKAEGWTTEAIEDYILKNSQEEALRLGLLDEQDIAIYEAKIYNLKNPKRREIPAVTVYEVQKISPGPSCKKRQAPEPPSWRPSDIENYLLENNMDENLRLGLISRENIEIYEWKRATGMSPICDTSWTRETLRKNKVIRESSSSSLSMSPPESPVTTPQLERSHEVPEKTSSPKILRKAPSPAPLKTPSPRILRKAPSPPVPKLDKPYTERSVDVPQSPIVLPPKRQLNNLWSQFNTSIEDINKRRNIIPTIDNIKQRTGNIKRSITTKKIGARAPPLPPLVSVLSAPTTIAPSTPDRKTPGGHFAFRGFKVGQRVNKGVTGGISLISQAVSIPKEKPGSPSHSAEPRPEDQSDARPEPRSELKPESKVKKLGLDRIGVKLPGLAKDVLPSAITNRAVTPSDPPQPENEERTPTRSRPTEASQTEVPATKRETAYRKLARLLGKDVSPTPTPQDVVPAYALFLRENPPITSDAAADDEEGGVRKKLSDMKLRLGWLRRRGDTQVSVRPLPEEAQGWAESFHNLMASKYGQALFKAFLQREFSEENVEFWLAVEDFKKTRAAKMPSKASKIHSDYVAVQAPKEINLDPGTRAQIAKSLDCPDKCIFDAAQKRVQALMESDAYLRFLQSELYKELLHPESSPSSNPETL